MRGGQGQGVVVGVNEVFLESNDIEGVEQGADPEQAGSGVIAGEPGGQAVDVIGQRAELSFGGAGALLAPATSAEGGSEHKSRAKEAGRGDH